MHSSDHTATLRNAIIYDVILPRTTREQINRKVAETESLLGTYGGIARYKIIQHRHHPSSSTFVGFSKLQEIIALADEIKADLIIFNDHLTNKQIYALEGILEKHKKKIEVWDRVDLIVMIFSKHARSAEAKLQLELARIEQFGPRIYGMGIELSRQAGGIGTRGKGETNTEIMKRHLSSRKQTIKTKLKQLAKMREVNLNRRKKNGFMCVSILGYTNAGKSRLFSTLSGRKVLVEDKLFATLDTTTTRVFLPRTKETILLSDTIGFIRDLPATLINAFKSTLLEVEGADLLIQVIDVSEPNFKEKIRFVERIVHEMGVHTIPMLYLFNKVDLLDAVALAELHDFVKQYEGLLISAHKGININNIKTKIEEILFPEKLKSVTVNQFDEYNKSLSKT